MIRARVIATDRVEIEAGCVREALIAWVDYFRVRTDLSLEEREIFLATMRLVASPLYKVASAEEASRLGERLQEAGL